MELEQCLANNLMIEVSTMGISKELIEKGNKSFIHNYKQIPLVFEKGEGCTLIDVEGKPYLDFVAGIAVNALGYSHETLKNALKNQVDQFLHCSNLYWNQPSIEAAEKLVKASGLDKVFFCNSGAEANEAALKLTRKYAKKKLGPDRYEIISMKNSFHGRTYGAITATGQVKYQKDLNPMLPGFNYAKYNDIDDLKNKISENTCGVLVEVIQGEGGIIPAEKDYLKQVEALCKENNLVLILDEVQTGIGRTGEIFAFQNYDIQPDIVCLAKGLGAGVPVGAIVASEEVAIGFEPGDHASTFGGNPLACTAVNVVLDELITKDLLKNVKQQGQYLKEKLIELRSKHTCIKEIRGMGLMVGIELEGKEPAQVIESCKDNGLLLVGAGSQVIRFVPPLVVTKEDIDLAITILDQAMDK